MSMKLEFQIDKRKKQKKKCFKKLWPYFSFKIGENYKHINPNVLHNMIEFLKNSDKENIFKAPREKRHILYKGTEKINHGLIIRNYALQKTVECILKCWKGKKKMSTWNFKSSKKIIQKWRWNDDFFRQMKRWGHLLPVGLNLKNITVLQAVGKWCQMESWINTKD